MSRTQVTQTSCDLCTYGGPWTRPEDFRQFANGVDLCKWCADDRPKAWLECGQHRIEFTAESWECSCGERYSRPLFLMPGVRDAVPNMLNATANMHVQS